MSIKPQLYIKCLFFQEGIIKMEDRIDLRVKKTKHSIKESFIQLMEEIGFTKINVKKIIERAGVNRSTFYLHYQDKFDLLNQVEDEFLDGYKKVIESCISIKLAQGTSYDLSSRAQAMNSVAHYIYENKKMLSLLTSSKGDPTFLNKIGGLAESISTDRNVIINPIIPQRYFFAFMSGMLTNIIGEWINSDFKEEPEQFSQIFIHLTKDISKNLLVQ